MATTAGLTASELLERGRRWFEFFKHATATRDTVAKALNSRGYGIALLHPEGTDGDKKGKARPVAQDKPAEHDRGMALYDAFALAWGGQTLAGGTRSVQATAEDKAEAALRDWLRRIHAEILAIRREETAPVLSTLQTLGELSTLAGLNASAEAMLTFLGRSDVQAALADYYIGEAERAEGKQLLDSWWAARRAAAGARTGHGASTADKRQAMDAFEAWLNKWWGIAGVRLSGLPGVLAQLGVESKRRGASAEAPAPADGGTREPVEPVEPVTEPV